MVFIKVACSQIILALSTLPDDIDTRTIRTKTRQILNIISSLNENDHTGCYYNNYDITFPQYKILLGIRVGRITLQNFALFIIFKIANPRLLRGARS